VGNHSKQITAGTLLVALGIIYGDIGTSPLYVLKAILGEKEITIELEQFYWHRRPRYDKTHSFF